ncbi:hypothetical protein B566_EDAN008157 [Ephemera danica]|nr:hypothetical protein B566_EDAN008157 [Ephemera danica]
MSCVPEVADDAELEEAVLLCLISLTGSFLVLGGSESVDGARALLAVAVLRTLGCDAEEFSESDELDSLPDEEEELDEDPELLLDDPDSELSDKKWLNTLSEKDCYHDKIRSVLRVSSVLNRNAKEYGKQFLFDDKEDTCWNSEQFQGGFVGQDCVLQACSLNETLQPVQSIYPEDVNAMQTFSLDNVIETSHLRINFVGRLPKVGAAVIWKRGLSSEKPPGGN